MSPCYDPTCECCKAWDGLTHQLINQIEQLEAQLRAQPKRIPFNRKQPNEQT
jgi:hypothetical protein